MDFPDSARSTAQKVIRGEVSATELVQSCLTRIKQHNPAINAIVTLDERGALESARQADALSRTLNPK